MENLAASWLTGFRGQQQAEVVRKVRQLRLELALENWSDTDLRREMTAIRVAFSETQHPSHQVQSLATAFAIVDESIRRRLGAWRIFTGSSQPSSFENCFQASQGMLDLQDLSPSERAVTEAIQQVTESGKWSLRLGPPGSPLTSTGPCPLIDTTGSLLFQPPTKNCRRPPLAENAGCRNAGRRGKTVAIALPAITHALKGQQVHIITANDYLASGLPSAAPVYRSLGFSAGPS